LLGDELLLGWSKELFLRRPFWVPTNFDRSVNVFGASNVNIGVSLGMEDFDDENDMFEEEEVQGCGRPIAGIVLGTLAAKEVSVSR